jgi:phasin
MIPVSEVSVEVQENAKSRNGVELPLFAMNEAFRGLARQATNNAKENCERLKEATGEIAGIVRDACVTNAKGSADYASRLIEISGQNVNAAFDFVTRLLDSTSLAETVRVSTEHGCRNFAAAVAQNKELFELGRKLATEAAEPARRSHAKALESA